MESAYSMNSSQLPLECLHLSFSISSFFEFALLSLWLLEVRINIAHTLNWLFQVLFGLDFTNTFIKPWNLSEDGSSFKNQVLSYAIWSFPQVWDFGQHWLHFILSLFPLILEFHLLSSKSVLNLQGVNALWGSINFYLFI